MRRLAVLLVIAGMMALSVPVHASPTEPDPYEETWFDCSGVEVHAVWVEWSQLKQLDGQEVLLIHATRTYTVEGESRPFFRFVSSYVDRFFESQDGEATSLRAGIDDTFIGHTLLNEATGDVVHNGQETLAPDDQACGVLTG